MTIRTILVCLSAAAFTLFAAAACEIHNCEEGAWCNDDEPHGDEPQTQHSECTSYCWRLSVCGAPQGRDLDGCVDSCLARYKRLPSETHRLCACAPESTCSDVTEGRCTDPNAGYGGSPAGVGGSPAGLGGSPSGNGGSPPASGGSSPGTGGETSGIECRVACDCPADQNCVNGYCAPL
jgi:hypothetical protein